MRKMTLGVDIAKADFAAYAIADGHNLHSLKSCKNHPGSFGAFRDKVMKLAKEWACDTIYLVIEPTGGYELPLARWALEHDWLVSMPNPRRVRDWARGSGMRAKTDAVDAKMLALFGQAMDLLLWKDVPLAVRKMKQHLDSLDHLREDKRREQNRLQAIQARHEPDNVQIPSIQRTIAFLDQEIARIEASLDDFLECHPRIIEEANRLDQVPGVGKQTRLYLLAFLYRWGALTDYQGDRKGITAYAGLDPVSRQSGTSIRGRAAISHQGSRSIRAKLFMAALGGKRGKTVLGRYYNNMVNRGKPKMVALIACEHKILMWAWAVFRDKADFVAAKAEPKTRSASSEMASTA